jgi:glucose-1-phosphate cytidylyltransferase
MQTIILCGGKGTRMKEETEFRPKPMVEVGGLPLLWHIMRIYMYYGFNEFVIALGYKGEMIKEYFLNWRTLINDFSLDMATGEIQIFGKNHGDFKMTFVNTGLETLTGGRIRRVAPYLTGEEFMLTYGDGVSDIDLKKLIAYHNQQGTFGTISGVHASSRYGQVDLYKETGLITKFLEKPILHEYISGGFMIFRRQSLGYFTDGRMEEGLARLAKDRQLSMYKHEGFWKAVDTYNELEQLNKLWDNERPWAVWEKKQK